VWPNASLALHGTVAHDSRDDAALIQTAPEASNSHSAACLRAYTGSIGPSRISFTASSRALDFKGENYAVTAHARRELGQHVILVDPFSITGNTEHALNWLDTLDPDSPYVVSRAAGLADMLIAVEGNDADSHWTDTACELLRGLLVHVATLPAPRRTMAELRRIVTASEDDLAATLADMTADPERGQRIPARAAAAYLNRPEWERGSVLSTVVRHTAWLDDPRLCAALARSDFSLADLKRQPMTVYLAIPPDRLRAYLGFVRGFIGLALDGITAAQGSPYTGWRSSSMSSASSGAWTAWRTA
jgi:type IV secretion system protein VirD4